MRVWLVTGGAGFIGTNFVLTSIAADTDLRVIVLDKLTYAGNRDNLSTIAGMGQHTFIEGDVCDRSLVSRLLRAHQPTAIVHFAAESHVDRSIDNPGEFVRTNVVGTFEMLEAARLYVGGRTRPEADGFRFLHVSTDEVYGSLGATGHFVETSAFAPNSPYAASKAGADHLVRAYARTYGLGTITTNCSNNYGPYQFPEKLFPLMILNALEGKSLPIYGDGQNVRDWLFVEDHCDAIRVAIASGRTGETYNIGGDSELTNLELVGMLCELLDELAPVAHNPKLSGGIRSYRELITFVPDRPGHDRRYAIDASKARRVLGWTPRWSIKDGMRATVKWYLAHLEWCDRITARNYARSRLGLGDNKST